MFGCFFFIVLHDLHDFAGVSLMDFMPLDDADRAMQHFRSLCGGAATVLAHAFHTRLVDSCSTKLETEVFQVKLALTSAVALFETRSLIETKNENFQGVIF